MKCTINKYTVAGISEAGNPEIDMPLVGIDCRDGMARVHLQNCEEGLSIHLELGKNEIQHMLDGIEITGD